MFPYNAADSQATLEPRLQMQLDQQSLQMLHPLLRLPQQLGNHWCKKEANMVRFCKFRQPEYVPLFNSIWKPFQIKDSRYNNCSLCALLLSSMLRLIWYHYPVFACMFLNSYLVAAYMGNCKSELAIRFSPLPGPLASGPSPFGPSPFVIFELESRHSWTVRKLLHVLQSDVQILKCPIFGKLFSPTSVQAAPCRIC